MFIVTTVEDIIRIPHAMLAASTVQAIFHEIDQKYPNKVLYDVGLCLCRYDNRLLKLTHGVCVAGDGGSHHTCTFRLVIFRPFLEEVLLGKISKSTPEGIHVTLGFFNDIFIPAYWMLRPSHYEESIGLWVWTPKYDDENEEGMGEALGKNGQEAGLDTTDHVNTDITSTTGSQKIKAEEVADVKMATNDSGNGHKAAASAATTNEPAGADENRYEMDIGAEIRFKVKSIHFTQVTNTAKGVQAVTSSTAHQIPVTSSTPFLDEPGVAENGNARRRRSSSVGVDQTKVPAAMHIVASICEDGLGLVSWWTNQEEDHEEEEAEGEHDDAADANENVGHEGDDDGYFRDEEAAMATYSKMENGV